MHQLHKIYQDILSLGEQRDDRTGQGTIAVFGTVAGWDLRDGFPAVTTKKLAWKAVVGELLWFLSGNTTLAQLSWYTHDGDPTKRTIWHPNYEKQGKDLGYENGYLGPVYGAQWRNFNGVDQISNLIDSLKNDPSGRRHLVSAWNPADMPKMTLPPCHFSFECYVSNDGKLSLMWHQRSVDTFLGLPFNIASYALLLHILAKLCGYEVGDLIFTGGDTHIYLDHLDQVKTQLTREEFPLPKLILPEFDSLEDLAHLQAKDFVLEGYQHHGALTGNMSA